MARTTDERSDDTPLHPTPRNTNPRRPSGGSDLLNVATELSTPAVAQPNTVASDIPIPVKASVEEAPAAVEIRGDRLISGIDLIDFGAGGLIPQKLYVVKGAQGLGKSILGLQFLSRGLEHGEPGILVTDQRPANVIEQAKALGFPI
ncbi:MAG TPA: ATPase domain-containing protein, partial [Thermoanaerobaculia bacterium]|nr:ATPase domain-containing protein [Thermoanaerobaculia bacterium]